MDVAEGAQGELESGLVAGAALDGQRLLEVLDDALRPTEQPVGVAKVVQRVALALGVAGFLEQRQRQPELGHRVGKPLEVDVASTCARKLARRMADIRARSPGVPEILAHARVCGWATHQQAADPHRSEHGGAPPSQ
jgi:hypothetical protein